MKAKHTILWTSLVLVLILASCGAGSDEAIVETLEDISSVWHRTPIHSGWGEVYVAFDEGGTCRLAIGSADRVETNPLTQGEIWFDEGQFHIKDISGSPSGPACLESELIGTCEAQELAEG